MWPYRKERNCWSMWALLGEGEASGKKQLTGGAGRGFTLLTGWWKQAPVPSSQGMGRRWKPLAADQEVCVDCWLRSPDPLAFSWTENMNKIQGRRWQLNGNCSWVKRWGVKGKTVTWFQFLVWLPPSCHLLCKLQGSSRCPCLHRAGQEAKVPPVCEHPVSTWRGKP